MADPTNPLVVQSDFSLYLEVFNPKFEVVRNGITKFAELDKSPEYIHTYKISALSIWNAASSGIDIEEIVDFLNTWSKIEVPKNVITEMRTIYKRFGVVEILKCETDKSKLILHIKEKPVEIEVLANDKLKKFLLDKIDDGYYHIELLSRGTLKVAFFGYNIPVNDIAGYAESESLPMNIRQTCVSGAPFVMREYQNMAVDAFYQSGSNLGGHGTIVLPCGAGKTIVAIGVMAKVQKYTLILATSVAAVHQWIREIIDKTDIDPSMIGEYTGDKKEIKPITVSTYQILIYRKNKESDFPHFGIFQAKQWGLIVYDEVHLLPAPIFKITTEIQSTRRLGLTATLVREDHHEKDVFCLIGPKKYDTPWKVLEKQGWISQAKCFEIKIPMNEDDMMDYLTADQKSKFNISAKNPLKIKVLQDIMLRHPNEMVLVIGQFIDQLEEVSKTIGAPLIIGKTPNSQREELYRKFRTREIRALVVSKVANFSIDLPDAAVLIQLSGTYGSRQEEAQRLGRILRPKENNVSYFYTITTKDSLEETYSHNRQRFLTEQGYGYEIESWEKEELI